MDNTNPQLAGLPKLRRDLDIAYTAFRRDPSVHNRLNLDVALSVYQIALAQKCANSANLHHWIAEDARITAVDIS